jgi:hypothetical protein
MAYVSVPHSGLLQLQIQNLQGVVLWSIQQSVTKNITLQIPFGDEFKRGIVVAVVTLNGKRIGTKMFLK